MKLTNPQRLLLYLVVKEPMAVHPKYKPGIALVTKGLAVLGPAGSMGGHPTLTATENGRRLIEGKPITDEPGEGT